MRFLWCRAIESHTEVNIPCPIAECRNLSPPPSPAIAVFATSRDFSTQSPLGDLLPSPAKSKHGRPSGPACCFVFGYRLGRVNPVRPTPYPGLAVHRVGATALHWAALHGNRRIVRLLIASKAAVNAKSRGSCAFAASALVGAAAKSSPSAVQEHAAAYGRGRWRIRRDRRTAPERRRRGCPEQRRVPLRCTAQPTDRIAAHAQVEAEADRGRVWEACGVRGG